MLQAEHSAILLTFIKLPFIFKTFVLSIFEWLFYTGFAVMCYVSNKKFGIGPGYRSKVCCIGLRLNAEEIYSCPRICNGKYEIS